MNLNDLDGAVRKNAGELESLRRAQDRVAEGAEEAGAAGVSAVEGVSTALAAAGVFAGIRKLADGFAECTRTAADFERAMSAVEAIAGASEAGITALDAEAKRLGASTVFTAQQSAEAMNYMAMAGWSTEEMLAGMSGVMDAAAASGEDLASVSDIITDSLTAFNLKADDAAHFSDILAQASARSNTNIGMMGQTFQRAAPVAAALGYSAEDTAAAIGLMANNGIKASKAGTALVNIFNGMLEGATLTSEAFGEYEFSAIRADGTMKSFAGTIDELRGKFAEMTEAERVMNAKEIAGLRGYSGLLAILNSTEEEYRSLQDEINNCAGAAQRMAETKLDNLSGDVTLMQSAWEGLKITIGEQFNPTLREGAGALTEAIGGVDRVIQKAPALVKGLSGAAGGFALVTGAVTALNGALKLYKTLSAAGVFNGLSGGLLAASAAIGGLIGIAEGARQEFLETVTSATELNEAVEKLNDTISETSVRDIRDDVMANAAAAETYLGKIEKLGRVQSRSAEQESAYQAAMAGLLETAPEFSEYISQTADAYGRVTYEVNGSTDAIREHIETMKQQALVDAYQDVLTEAYKAQAEAEKKRQRAILDRMNAQEKYGRLLVRQENLLEKLNTPGPSKSQDKRDLDEVTGQINDLGRQIDEYGESIRDAEAEVKESGRSVEAVKKAMDETAEALGAGKNGADGFSEGMDGVSRSTSDAVSPLEDVSAKLVKLQEDYEKAYDAALKSVHGQYSLWDEAAKTKASNLDSVEKAMQSQIANWTGRTENLELLSGYVGEVSGLYTLLGELAGDTSQESANLLAGLAGAAKKDDLDTLKKFAGAYVDLQEKQKKYAAFQAGFETNIGEVTEELLSKVDEAVKGMERSDEAYAAGRENVLAFLEGARDPDNLSAIDTVFGAIADRAMRKLNGKGGVTQEFLIQMGVEHYTPNSRAEAPAYDEEHAEGGILTRPHIGLVAEDGPEAVIPLSASRRDRGAALWEEAGRRMGLLQAFGNEIPVLEPPAVLEREITRMETVRRELAEQGGWDEAERGTGSGGLEQMSAAASGPGTSGDGAGLPSAAPPGNITAIFNVTIAPGTPEETVDGFREFMDSGEFRDKIVWIQEELAYDARRRSFK